ncbi:MAG: hypothetical protein AB7H93_06235 [Vicinamibacterales bacterium]
MSVAVARALVALIGVAVLTRGAAAPRAQTPVDFSGRWVAVATPVPTGAAAQAATLRGDLGSGWGTTFVVTQDAAQVVVESVVYSAYDLQPQPRFVYALDGRETRRTLMLGRGPQVQESRAAWDGVTLRLATAHHAVDPASGRTFAIEVVQRLTLESPATLVVETTRGAPPGGVATTTRTTYAKQ